MPIEIGKSLSNFHEDPIQVMTECHRRILSFLQVIITIKRQAQGSFLDDRQKLALEAALRYFREAAPWHILDEEESLFPRIRLSLKPDRKDLHDLIQGLEMEHAVVQVCHREIDELGTRWMRDETLSDGDSRRFAEMLGKLSIIYHNHLHQEETTVFPLAREVLREPEVRAIGREMAGRRQAPLVYEMMAGI